MQPTDGKSIASQFYSSFLPSSAQLIIFRGSWDHAGVSLDHTRCFTKSPIPTKPVVLAAAICRSLL